MTRDTVVTSRAPPGDADEVNNDNAVVNNISEFMAYAHESVNEVGEDYKNNDKR